VYTNDHYHNLLKRYRYSYILHELCCNHLLIFFLKCLFLSQTR